MRSRERHGTVMSGAVVLTLALTVLVGFDGHRVRRGTDVRPAAWQAPDLVQQARRHQHLGLRRQRLRRRLRRLGRGWRRQASASWRLGGRLRRGWARPRRRPAPSPGSASAPTPATPTWRSTTRSGDGRVDAVDEQGRPGEDRLHEQAWVERVAVPARSRATRRLPRHRGLRQRVRRRAMGRPLRSGVTDLHCSGRPTGPRREVEAASDWTSTRFSSPTHVRPSPPSTSAGGDHRLGRDRRVRRATSRGPGGDPRSGTGCQTRTLAAGAGQTTSPSSRPRPTAVVVAASREGGTIWTRRRGADGAVGGPGDRPARSGRRRPHERHGCRHRRLG